MFISFNEKGKKFLLLYFLVLLLYNIITKKMNNAKFIHHLLFKMSMFIFYIFEKIILNNKLNTELSSVEKSNYQKIILILCSNIFILLYLYMKMKIKNYLFGNSFMIFFMDMIFIKKKIFSHHYLSIFINTIVFFFIRTKEFLNENILQIVIYNIQILLISYNYCFSYLLLKQINRIYFTSIFFLMGLMALSESLYRYKEMIGIFHTFNFGILELIFYILGGVCYHFCKCQILIKYDVTHFIIVNTLLYLINTSKVFEIICIIIFTISSMIYLEIIELHFCGLDYYLKNEIIKRGHKELHEIISINDSIID